MISHPSQPIVFQSVGIQLILAILLICTLFISGCIDPQFCPPDKTTTDLVQDSEGKVMIRELANPISDEVEFSLIIRSVITNNPFVCTAYMADGQNHTPVEKVKELYIARIEYVDANGTYVGSNEDTYYSFDGFNAGIEAIMANNRLSIAHGGIAMHDSDHDTYYATLQCHDPNGEIYFVTLSRDEIVLAAYSDEAIRTKVEKWANSVPSLKQKKATQA